MTTGPGDSRTMGSGPLFGDAAKAAMARGSSPAGPQTSRDPGSDNDSDATRDARAADDPRSADVTRSTDDRRAPERPRADRDSRSDPGTKPAGDDRGTRRDDVLRDDGTSRELPTFDDRGGGDRRTPAVPPTRVVSGGPGTANGTGAGGAAVGAAARRPMTVGTAPVARKKGRRARLTVKRIDPWSTLKFSFVYGLAGMVVLLVTVVVLYGVVDAMGVIDSIRTFIGDVSSSSDNGSGLIVWLGFSRVMLVAVVIGAINVVLFTAFATLTAFIYNVCTDIVGGVEVTLAERG